MAPTKGPVERYPLSDGSCINFYRFGHKYVCLRIFPEMFTPPEEFTGTKDEALAKVEEYLKKDVCEVD